MFSLKRHIRTATDLAAEAKSGTSLRGKVMQNVGWMGIGYSFDLVIRFLSSIILTRLLDPSAYGLITTVTVFLTFTAMFSDLGIRTIVLADKRGDDREFLGVLWTIQILRGFFMAAAIMAIGLSWHSMLQQGWIANNSNYANPMLPQLLMLVGLSLAVNGFSSLNEFRAVRNLERGAVSRMDIGTRIGGTIITVLLVFLFRTVWAMAAAIVITAIFRTILTHLALAGPRMALRLNLGEIGKVLKLSRWVAINSILTVVTSQADKVLIGYCFGLGILGVYAIAFTLFQSAITLVNQLNNSMCIPLLRALSDKPESERLASYYKFRLPIELYCIAAGLGMALFGPLFFAFSYDARYHDGGTYLALLGIKVILLPITLSGNFLLSEMRYKMTLFIGAIRSTVFLTAMGVAIYLRSVELMVLFIALERLPEIILYFTLPGTGIPFSIKRDGALLGLAGVIAAYLLIWN